MQPLHAAQREVAEHSMAYHVRDATEQRQNRTEHSSTKYSMQVSAQSSLKGDMSTTVELCRLVSKTGSSSVRSVTTPEDDICWKKGGRLTMQARACAAQHAGQVIQHRIRLALVLQATETAAAHHVPRMQHLSSHAVHLNIWLQPYTCLLYPCVAIPTNTNTVRCVQKHSRTSPGARQGWDEFDEPWLLS
jgi:hypothetical protein